MPQMAPISWLILFFVFSFSFIVFNMLNYYCFNKNFLNNNFKQIKNLNLNNSMIWKW